MKKIFPLACLLLALVAGCKKNVVNPSGNTLTLPDISSFAQTPSDQFILDASGLALVENSFPFKGDGLACSHQGAHLPLKQTGNDYTVNVYAPADGYVNRIADCGEAGGFSKYEISLAFAQWSGNVVTFEYSFEPGLDPGLCTGPNGYYDKYIHVAKGDNVKKGQVIAQMFKSKNLSEGAHIHFHLASVGSNTFFCPNIFNETVTKAFAAQNGIESCEGNAFGATLCYKPADGQDIVGLLTAH